MAEEYTLEELLGSGDLSPSAVKSLERSAPSTESAVSVGGAALGRESFAGSKTFDRALSTWTPTLDSADNEMLGAKETLDARTRDSFRNDAYVQGGGVLHQDNIVGSLYLLNAKPQTKLLWGSEDEVWEEEFQEEVETKFMLAAESPSHWFDASRIGTLTEMTRVITGAFVASGGEALATAEWMPAEGRPFRTAIQLVDADRLSDPRDRTFNRNDVRGGVRLNAYGAPEAYYIQMAHPSDWTRPGFYRWKEIPARKPWGRPQVLHIYDRRRPAQTRGIAAFAAALKESKMARTFRDVVLQNAILNATIAVSLESDLPPESVFASFGAKEENPFSAYAHSYLESVGQYSEGARNLSIDGVKIPHLFPGTKMRLHPAGKNDALGTEFEKSLLRYMASSLGVSYEQLSRDYTSTNYSSARAAMAETWKFMQSRKKMVADRFASFVYRLWFEEAMNKGQIEALKRRNVPSFYEGLNAEAYTNCDWIGAARGQIDELKETQAAVLRIANRLSTQELEIARMTGADWRTVARQIRREQRNDEKLGLAPIQASTNRPTAAVDNETQEAADANE